MTKLCPLCGNEFSTTHRTRKYCSKQCAARAPREFSIAQVAAIGGRSLRGTQQSPEHVRKRAVSLAATLATTRRACPECQEEFTPRSAPQRYCSGRCADNVRRRKSYVIEGARTGRKDRARVTAEEYAAMLAEQDGACAICKGTNGNQRLGVDHCHDSGRVRGLLCHRCNTAIGLMRDDRDLLTSAISYLTHYQQEEN